MLPIILAQQQGGSANGRKVTLNYDCLRRIVPFCVEPLFGLDGVAREERVAQPTLAALMRVSKQFKAWASPYLYTDISVDAMSMITSLFGDAMTHVVQPLDGETDQHSATRAAEQEPNASGRSRQLARIQTMHLDLRVYMDEDDDPMTWHPPAFDQLASLMPVLHQGSACHRTLPKLRSVRLIHTRPPVWRVGWTGWLLTVLSRIGNVELLCYAATVQGSSYYFQPDLGPFFRSLPPTQPRPAIRAHRAWKDIDAIATPPTTTKVDIAYYRPGEFTVVDMCNHILSGMRRWDHQARLVTDADDVAHRSLYISIPKGILTGDDGVPLRPPVAGPGEYSDSEAEDGSRLKAERELLSEVQGSLRSHLGLGFFNQWISAERLELALTSEVATCKACGR